MRCKCCNSIMKVEYREVILAVNEEGEHLTKRVLEDLCSDCHGGYMEDEDEFGFLDSKEYAFSSITELPISVEDVEFSDILE